MTGAILFDPLLAWPLVWAVAALALFTVVLAVVRRLSGWWLRALAAIAVLVAILNPAYQRGDLHVVLSWYPYSSRVSL